MVEKRIVKRRHRATKPPFSMYGSKQRMLPRLMSFVSRAPHKLYVEVFGGTGALLLAKPRSPYEVYNDMNSGFVDMFRVIRDEKKFNKFQRLIEYTPYAKEEWEVSRGWKKLPRGSVERAVAFFVLMSLSFCGRVAQSPSLSRPKGKGENFPRTYDRNKQSMPFLVDRLRGVMIENESFETLIPRYDQKSTLFYCDPPYTPETRTGGANAYECEMTIEQHKILIGLLNDCKGKVILSGYSNKVYQGLLGFTRYDFDCYASTGGKSKALGGKRLESVWINF